MRTRCRRTAHLFLDELAAQEPPQEALDRLHVVGAEHPAEVVVQLQVGGRARGLTHRADDVGTLLVLDAQEAVEDLGQRADVVQAVEDDDVGQVASALLALLGDVGQVLTQLLARLVVHVERGDGARAHVLARPKERQTVMTSLL